MKTLRTLVYLSSVLGGAVVATGSVSSAAADPCAAQQAAVDQAVATLQAVQPGTWTAAAMRAAKADLQNKRVALKCCRNPTLYGCSK